MSTMEVYMINLINEYIQYKSIGWSLTTIRSERFRLKKIQLDELYNPRAAYVRLNTILKPYSLKTLFIRMASLHDWLLKTKQSNIATNPYKEFIVDNPRLFNKAYQKEIINITFDEALKRLQQISNLPIREHAIHLLKTGLRFNESLTEQNGYVLGKGSKARKVFSDDITYNPALITYTYSTFRRELKKVGLKPHTLRKLFATRLVQRGVSAGDLLHILGWSTSTTAFNYLQARKDTELTTIIQEAISNGI